MAGLHIVVGAGRPLGAAVVYRLRTMGESVRAVVIDKKRLVSTFDQSVELAEADPLNPLEIDPACKDAGVIYNCFEPMFSRRDELGSRVNSSLLMCAIRERAGLVVASRVYNSEADNQVIEADVQQASDSGMVKALIAQFPQLYGPGVCNEVLAGVFEAALKGKKASWPGPLNVPRSLVYSLDAADALVNLGVTELAYGRRWSISGPGPLTGQEFIETAFRAAGRKVEMASRLKGLPSLVPIRRGNSPYDYESSFVMDGGDMALAFPSFTFTPHETAISSTLEWFRERIELKGVDWGVVGTTEIQD